jgi:hypothetical protein
MYFSTTASFVARGALSAIGVASLARARRRYEIITAIPLFFGIQRILEGF